MQPHHQFQELGVSPVPVLARLACLQCPQLADCDIEAVDRFHTYTGQKLTGDLQSSLASTHIYKHAYMSVHTEEHIHVCTHA